MHRNIRGLLRFKNVSGARTENASSPPLCWGTLCVSAGGGRKGARERGRTMEGEKRRTGKMCLFHTSYCPRRLPSHCLSQSRPLSFNGSAATPVVQYLTSRPSFISRVLRHSRGASAALARDSTHTSLFFGYLTESGLL